MLGFPLRTWLIVLPLLAGGVDALGALPVLELGAEDEYRTGRTIAHYESAGELSFERILTPREQARFAQNTGQHFDLGFSRNRHWFRLRVRNGSSRADWVLVIDDPFIDRICFYDGTDAPDPAYEQGGLLPFDRRYGGSRHFLFPLRLEPGAERTYYFFIESEETIQLRPIIRTEESQKQFDLLENLLLGVYFGMLAGMLLYNVFLWIIIRESTYLFYVLFLGAVGFFFVSYYGLGFQYIWPDHPRFARDLNPRALGVVLFAAAPFMRKILRTREFAPPVDQAFRWAMGAAAVQSLVIVPLDFRMGAIAALLITLYLVVIILLGAIAARRNHYAPGTFVLVAWSTLLVATTVGAAKALGWVPHNIWTHYSLLAGSALEMILLSIALGFRFTELRAEKNRIHLEMEEQNLRLRTVERELQIGRDLQRSLLPGGPPSHVPLKFAVHYRPWIEVGGDVYDYMELADPPGLSLFVADAPGHGIGAALLASMIRGAYQDQSLFAREPAMVLDQMNERIANGRDATFISAQTIFIDLERGLLRHASAGHPPPVYFERATGQARFLENFGPILGWLGAARYSFHELPFEEGDRLLMYTDGVTEAQAMNGNLFGEKRLLATVEASGHSPLESLCTLIAERVETFSLNARHGDDMTIVAVEF